MSCANDPNIEQMERDLIGGGWAPSHGGMAWTSLWGLVLRGPHRAWHYWAGEPMDLPYDGFKGEAQSD